MAGATDPPRRRGVLGRAVGTVAPAVLRQIDTEDLVEAVDVNVIVDALDLDALIAHLDLDAVAARLDLDALVDRLDVNAVAGRLDLDALVDRLDVNAVADRLDLDALVDRLDIDRVAGRLDLDALVDRLDVNAVAGRLDLDALVDRLDVNAVADRLDVTRLTAGVTQDVAVSGLDLARRQFVRADATVDGVVGRVLRRDPAARPEAPGRLAQPDVIESEVVDDTPSRDAGPGRREVSGHYAGVVTRLLGLAGDLLAAVGLQAVIGWVTFFFVGLVFDVDAPTGVVRWVGVAVLGSVLVLYFWLPVALFGRTPAMAIVGIAVVRRDGGLVDARRAFVRALFLPLTVLVPLFLLGMVLGRERRTLADAASGTVEVYDWGERDAEQPVTIRQQLSARVRRHQAAEAHAPG